LIASKVSRNSRLELRSDITILDACDTEMRITACTRLRSQVRVPGRGRSAANSFCRGGFGHPAGFGSLTGYQVWNRMHGVKHKPLDAPLVHEEAS
jgi:hypothetical protein